MKSGKRKVLPSGNVGLRRKLPIEAVALWLKSQELTAHQRDCAAQLSTVRREIMSLKGAVKKELDGQHGAARFQPTAYDKGLYWSKVKDGAWTAQHFLTEAVKQEPGSGAVWGLRFQNEMQLGRAGRAAVMLSKAVETQGPDSELARSFPLQLAELERDLPAEEWAALAAQLQALKTPPKRARSGSDARLQMTPELGWSTVLMRVNLFESAEVTSDVAAMNRKLIDVALTGLQRFVGRGTRANHDFFKMQMRLMNNHTVGRKQLRKVGSAWAPLSQLPEFLELKRLVDQAFERYLDYVDSTPGEANMRSSVHHEDGEWESYGWAAVLVAGAMHPAHTHHDAIVAAVYYPQDVDPGSELVLYDPRGVSAYDHLREFYGPDTESEVAAVPPFGSIRLLPKAGDLVLFPGWLVHEARNKVDADVINMDKMPKPRVSIPFNLIGDWHPTVMRHQQ